MSVHNKTGYCKKWPYGIRFLLFLPIIQRHYTHPGFTGYIQAAHDQAAYQLHIISASYEICSYHCISSYTDATHRLLLV